MPHVISLSVELVAQVAAHLESIADLLALMSTCRWLRHIFEENAWLVSHAVIERSLVCQKQAWALASIQEKIMPSKVKNPISFTPGVVLRLARNTAKVTKAIDWFHEHEMKFVRPERVYKKEEMIEFWGSDRRPAHLTKSERRRFTCGYYLAAASMDPNGETLLDSVPIKYLYYVSDIADLSGGIGEERPRQDYIGFTDRRTKLQAVCGNKLRQFEKVFRSGCTIGFGVNFGWYQGYLSLCDQYQSSQVVDELLELPRRRGTTSHFTPNQVKEYIWGDLSDSDQE